MRKEIYDSLFNKTADTMTCEDYRLYRDLLVFRETKIFNYSIILECLVAPVAVIGLLVGTGSVSVAINPWILAGGITGLFTPCFGLLTSPSFTPWCREIKKFIKKEFSKEDLRLMKKEKIFKQLKQRCKEFEKTEKYKRVKMAEKNREEAGIGETEYFEYEEQTAALQQKQNELNQTLEDLRKAQKREKSNAELGKVFTDFESNDDNEKEL